MDKFNYTPEDYRKAMEWAKTYIIEEGRTPSSSFLALLMMAGGVIIILGAGAWGVKSSINR